MYKRESTLRSLIKGISWRIIAVLDTLLIVILFTCWFGNCNTNFALKIGFYEFVFKFIVYFIHERIWQYIYKQNDYSNKKILFKTISWRLLATMLTFFIAGTVLKGYSKLTFLIAITEVFTKSLLYYYHEKLWLLLPLGRIRSLVRKTIKWKRI